MFPVPTELLLIGCSNRINLDPKIPIKYIADMITKGIFTRDEWNHLLCLFNISHFSSTFCSKTMAKKLQQDSGEERVAAKSKPMMNLISRYRVRDPNVLTSIASESPVKTRYESQIPLSSWNEQQPRTGRFVMGASLSDYSEWHIDDKWSSQERKYGEMSGTSTVRPVSNKLVIDDDMDSDTATESNLSLRSRSFLNRVNDRFRKILDHSSKDAMQDIDKHSLVWRMFVSSTLEASVFMGKNYSDNLHSIKKYRKQSHFEADVRHIWAVDTGTIRWDFWSVSNQLENSPWKQISLVNDDEEVLSLSHAKVYIFSDSVLCLGKVNQNPISNTFWQEQLGLFKDSAQYRTLDNLRRTDGIRVEYFPRIHNIAACRRSPRVHKQNGRPSAIQRTKYLHVDVRWHLMVIWRKWTGM